VAAKIKFEFKDSNLFRIVHSDGAFGGPTPQGDLYLSFYSERLAVPKAVTHKIVGDTFGEEIIEERVVGDAVERTMEVAVVMNINAASNFHGWLGKAIAQMKSGGAASASETTQ
jgi:hypothetical protein